MSSRQKKSGKKVTALLLIIFSHILPVIVSAFYDKATHTSHNVKLMELKYCLGFFTGWSAWASLLTVPWAIYKLLTLSRKRSSYSEQMGDIVVAETNFLSGVIFCCGGFFLTIHTVTRHPVIVYPLLGNVKTIYVGLFYNFFWHVLAPGLACYYFGKYCQVDKLAKRKSLGLTVNLFNPIIYLFYITLRPLLFNFAKSSTSLPHNYPADYPYPPFFWIMGKFANNGEKNNDQSKFLWGSWHPSWLSGLIWLLITVIFLYIMFSLLFHFFVKFKQRRLRRKSHLLVL